jgi:hypothetical protein
VAAFTTENTKQLHINQQQVQQLEHLAHQYLLQQLSARRIIILGASQPSWRKHLHEGMYNGDMDVFSTEEHGNKGDTEGKQSELKLKSSYNSDLACLVNGDALCRTIGSIAQESWSGLDLIIHCGGSVDLSVTLPDAMSTLARAEVLGGQTGQRQEKEYNRSGM